MMANRHLLVFVFQDFFFRIRAKMSLVSGVADGGFQLFRFTSSDMYM